jgi:acetyltransferase
MPPIADRAHDVLRERDWPLGALFSPRSVAVIGATEAEPSVGRTLLRNIVSAPFAGKVYPINPRRQSVLGLHCYPSVRDVGEPVDLAVIVTPARTVPSVIGECAAAGVKGAVIISAGFKELGPEGVELERRVLEEAGGRLRIIGPNCLGLVSSASGLNATFAAGMPLPGKVGFLSQSGALCTAILDWSRRERVGFSAFVSVGSMLDVGWGDLIDYLGDDPRTQSIVIYMESVGDARSFVSAAREVALTKPIIVLKAGRTEQAARAAASHTGALTGSDEVLRAALRRAGVLRVETISELFDMAEVLGKQRRPAGPRLTILTNAGGPGVLATDALIGAGGRLAELAPETLNALDEILPPHWSRGNPIDVLGDAGPERFSKALEIAARDPGSDGLLAILAPQDMTDPTRTAQELRTYSSTGKPILASWMGGASMEGGVQILNDADIPTFSYPDEAARAFHSMWRYSHNLQLLYETPALDEASGERVPDRGRASALIGAALKGGRTLLTEHESRALLAAHGIPVVESRLARSAEEAVEAALAIGYPVVLKLHSETLTHKTDVGGVRLDLEDSAAVRKAYSAIEAAVSERAGPGHFQGVSVQPMVRLRGLELILGSSVDPQFGPIILFGAGGVLVEVLRDQALGLPPLTSTLARRMMEGTRIYTALKGVRNRPPVDMVALERLLVRFSRLVIEEPRIAECDINPLLAAPERLLALDARVVLHAADIPDERLPRSAIRPYPTRYVRPWKLRDGTTVTIRPIRPEDEPLMVRFHEPLSERTVEMRYFQPLDFGRRAAHDRLTRLCFIDYDRQLALVAEGRDESTGRPEILGIGRLSRLRRRDEAEFALLVSDRWQGQGLGSELLRLLVEFGREEKLRRICAEMLPGNIEMQQVSKKLGFRLERSAGDGVVRAELEI